MKKTTVKPQAKTSNFRLIKSLSVEDNIKRLEKHVERLQRKLWSDKAYRKLHLRKVRQQRTAAQTAAA